MDNWPESRKDQFTYDALKAIFEYFDNLDEDMRGYQSHGYDETEYDPIAICCEWSEYPSAWDAMLEYQPDDMPVEGEDGDDLVEIAEKNEAEARRWLEDNTTVLDAGKGIVIIQF